MSRIERRPPFAAAGLLVLCFTFSVGIPGLAQGQPGEVVVFGDSLSDPGNGFAFLRSNATPPDYGMDALLIPGAPYAIGGHHLTNGATWIEQLAVALGVGRSALPAFASSNPHAMNFAIGTARARNDGTNPSLALQIAAFLQKTGGVAAPDALYVFQIGGNDVRDAFASADPAQAQAILDAAAASIASGVAALYARGARHFLVWNVPDLGLTPTVRFLDGQIPGTAIRATAATAYFNGSLVAALGPLSAALVGSLIVPFDADGLIRAIVGTPGAFGMVNTTDACVTPNDAPFTCQAADEYLFWDGIHPTRAAHTLLAQAVALRLGL